MLVPVGEVAQQLRGVTYSKSEAQNQPTPGHVPILRANNITEEGLTFLDLVYVPSGRVSTKQLLREGDIVVTASSGSRDVIGKAARNDGEFEGSFGAFCKVLRPDMRHVDSRYFAHFFRTQNYRSRISALAAGININNIRNEHLDGIEIPLPPLEEQRRIATILDKADALRRTRKRALALLDTLTQSIFLEMFGDDAPEEEIGQLLSDGTLLVHKDGNHGSNYPRASDFAVNGVPFLSAQCIGQDGGLIAEGIKYLSHKKADRLTFGWLKKGHVLLSHNASVGKVAIYGGEHGDALIGTSLTCFRPDQDRLTTGFLFAVLRSDQFQASLSNTMSQTTRNQVPITAQRHIAIPIPSVALQRQFDEVVERIRFRSLDLKQSAYAIGGLFASLQSRAFTGEL